MEQAAENNSEEIFVVEGDEDATLSKTIEEAECQESFGPKMQMLQGELAKKSEEVQKAENKYLYLLAEFDNYKKRTQREQSESARFSNEKLLREMLVLLDNLERAVLHVKEAPDLVKITEGLDLVIKQFLACLGRYGVKPIESLNQPFDPLYHQAVGYIERAGCEKDQVAEEVQKGYALSGRVLRASMVLIAKGMAAVTDDGTPSWESVDKTI